MSATLTPWPLILVADLERSLNFYQHQLGFNVVEQAQAAGRVYWCRLERDGANWMLQQADPEDGSAMGRGRGVTFYFVSTDLEGLVADFTRRGLVFEPPVLTHYGMRQLSLLDPDGYQLCFEQPQAGSP